MDKAVNSALQLDAILGLIEPVGDSGRYFKHHLPVWKPGMETGLNKEYLRLNALMTAIANKQVKELFRSALADIPRIPQTLKALQERPLLLHECFELKKMLFYALELNRICEANGLGAYYHFPKLQKPYDLLDPEHLNSPSFALSAAFSPKLAQCIANLQDLQLALRHAKHRLMQTAGQALDLSQPMDTIVISRLHTTKAHKITKSSYYQLADENIANLTFKLKPTKQMQALSGRISAQTHRLTAIEDKVLMNLSKKLQPYAKALMLTADLITKLDWDYAKVIFAIKYDCIVPKLSKKMQINLVQAVNLPVLNNLQGAVYQPVDLVFSARINVLTGPNMGGKTTALKTVGQICLLTQYAIPLPAKSAELCLFDNIWFNHDHAIEENLSSFGREIVSLTGILKKKGRNLLLMDELAKGTNPAEGEILLLAVLEYLKQLPCLTLAATHFDKPAYLKSAAHFAIKGIDLQALAKMLKPIDNNLKEQLNLLNSLMNYSLVKLGKTTKPPHNAIPIAQALGLPEEIIKKALTLIK